MFQRIAEKYRNSTVMVIGAGGIGREVIRLIAPSVSRLWVTDFDPQQLDQVSELCPEEKLVTRQLDVADETAVAELSAELESAEAIPDFLFYTAGVLTIEPFLDTTAENWERVVAINLNGAFFCSHAIARLMVSRGRGSILLMGSIAGTKARSGSRVNPVYNSTKAAVAAFVNAAAMQLRPHGIRINCISPGPTVTPMMDIQPERVHATVREITLEGRLNLPAEVAEIATFVAAHGRFTGEDVGMGGGAGLGG
ncbi:MAG: SDR family NAD(P)-dependent oxidoreductase [Planctomycetota bacterium]